VARALNKREQQEREREREEQGLLLRSFLAPSNPEFPMK